MELYDILAKTVEMGGSDVFVVPGAPVMAKVNGDFHPVTEERIMPADTERLLRQIYDLDANRDIGRLLQKGDDDFSFSVKRLGRFRCNAYKQRGTLAAVLRVVAFGLPDPVKLGIPGVVVELANVRRGMVLVTGPAGSGKTTTLACIIDKINRERSGHIITLEDPIEFIHPHKKSIVSQRELESDTSTFADALRSALRQAPDAILLGEMRDFVTIQTAITAAETGHLLLSSLHTVGAAKTIDRIIDVFPAAQQSQVRVQLSMVLQAVVSQQLIPAIDGGIEPAFEIMLVNNAIQSLIRDSKTHQIDNVIFSGESQGMCTMDSSLLRLYREKRITRENALLYSANPDSLARKL